MTYQPYPIEVDFPKLDAYARGNNGIPYVYTFDSGHHGPHTMINSLIHGNEVCGAIAVKGLLDLGLRPRRGKLTLSFANVEAYQRFDRAAPDASRYIAQDLNRVWSPAILDDASLDSHELRRARRLRPLIDSVDLLLDLHSMHERCAPLNVCGPLDKGIALARELGAPAWVVSDAGHAYGCRLRDYGRFGDPDSPANALLVECGQHWEGSAVDVAKDSCARFLLLAGNVDAADLPAGWLKPHSDTINTVRVTDAIVAPSTDFRFTAPFTGLEVMPEAGTVIGWSAGAPVTTPYPDCVLVMPSLRQLRAGVTVVRLGRLID